MNSIVECVPNFSEGRNQNIINALTESVAHVEGIKLLGVEPDKDYNRTVMTFVGSPDHIVEGAFQATRTAARLIDMRKHKGEHPRLGATDVVPFVPVSGVSMEQCVDLARAYGQRVSGELGIPIYLYEYAAMSPQRRNLSEIRKGEYEGLKDKLLQPEWKPDFGDAVFNAQSGATVTGARKFLIAYNVNLNTPDSAVAHEIALRIRESGRPRKDESGKPIKDGNGKTVRIPGSLKAVKAMGVFLERFKISQVSINLIDYEITPPHIAFEEVKRIGQELGVSATGSEIVGMTPLQAVLIAGKFYATDRASSLDEHSLVGLAIERLGLSQLEPFDPKRKIIEYTL
jgi:glutamate formiminotransferase / formiminotetrahydrofolate cyclodeaminase